ncbi:ACT domain-containing protein ACR3 [Euphorbia lathyris]|uniref:ACT domain-containing protein ACR3 n=1 Tax=Euphorbia lathyris TaxID=212925 RepID=UPI00331423F8
MAKVCWPYFDPEYENLSTRINPPRVSVDNNTCKDSTLIKVDSMNKPGILLEVVQILSDIDLIITKAYISSDGGWFMDIFHVTDQQGKKISDSKTIEYIEKALGPKEYKKEEVKRVGVHSVGNYTAIELIGWDRPGLLSEITAILANLDLNVAAAEVWTHNRRIACVVYVTCGVEVEVEEGSRMSIMEEQLKNILRGCDDKAARSRTSLSMGFTHVDRRLHQMLFADRDYEDEDREVDYSHSPYGGCLKPKITVERCEEKGYSVVTVSCKDRAKLLFDIVCTLTDMQYVVFHANISSNAPYALQEYYIRHMDGCILDTQVEKERVIKCLEAAIQRRVCEGLSLEVCGKDRVGLLSQVTRILRENGLTVSRAGVTTVGEKAVNVFYVRDASGNTVDIKTIEALRKEIGHTMMLNVKKTPSPSPSPSPSPTQQQPPTKGWAKTSFFFGNLFEKFLP